ncbi:MAG: septum formation protein Maf [Clostridia bacterium]|nr:septum formation protein Maf [Clostridia bacterium]
MELILASGSERRRAIMSSCGYDFTVIKPDADESSIVETDPARLVERLSLLKASAVRDALPPERRESAVVLGSDTVVTLGEKILGKPRDAKDAVRMLRMESGNTNVVVTGVALLVPDGRGGVTEYAASDRTAVRFAGLDDDEIETYVSSGDPLDKAGAYGIQGPFSVFIERVEGSFSTVVGLPVHLVYRMLKAVGITPHF